MASNVPDSTPTVVPARRHRWTWITVLAVAVLSGTALVAVPAIAQSEPSGGAGPSHTPAPAEKVVVCESEVVDHGDGILTSSASAERVAADAPVPDGCRVG